MTDPVAQNCFISASLFHPEIEHFIEKNEEPWDEFAEILVQNLEFLLTKKFEDAEEDIYCKELITNLIEAIYNYNPPQKDFLKQVLSAMDIPLEKKSLYYDRCVLGMKREELAEKYNYSKEQIPWIVNGITTKIRNHLRPKKDSDSSA